MLAKYVVEKSILLKNVLYGGEVGWFKPFSMLLKSMSVKKQHGFFADNFMSVSETKCW